MTNFKQLEILSVVFKVVGFLILILMLIGLVGAMVAKDATLSAPVLMNMIFSGVLGFLLMYSFGEVIKLLLALESRTRKDPNSA